MNKTWTVTVLEDPTDPEQCIIPFPQEMIDELGWKEGDTLVWNEDVNGTFAIAKKGS